MSVPNLYRPQLLRCARRTAAADLRALRILHNPTVSRRHQSNGTEGRSFKGQLFESISARVQREQDDRERYARIKEVGMRPGAGSVLTAFAIASVLGYWLGTYSPRPTPPTSTTPLTKAPAPAHKTYTANMQAAWSDLKDVVGLENVSTSEDDRKAHAGSDWSSHPTQDTDTPFAVVRPATTEEVSQVVAICHERRIPVTAFAGGTSLEGHFSAPGGGICVDFGRMDAILQVNAADLDVVVQPAVGWEALNDDLAARGLFFPPDPGPGALIGGMVGTGCSGTNAFRYGTMRDWVVSLTVVLADGTVVKTRQRPRKSSAGYDLTRLFVGSEGTLGLVTEAVLKVTVKPAHTSVAVCAFDSVRAAADCARRVVGAGVPVGAMELLDDEAMRHINDAGATARRWAEAPTLFFKFGGSTAAAVRENVKVVQGLARAAGNRSFEFAKGEDEADELWSARKLALWSVLAKRRDESDHVKTTDVAVPISRLPDIIEETKADMGRTGLIGGMVGHVGDGNFHTVVIYNDSEKKVADEFVHRMVKRAIEMEGTSTGEHGVGLVKRDYLNHELGETTVDLMRKLKLALDPLCILNCDKTVRISKPQKGEVQEW